MRLFKTDTVDSIVKPLAEMITRLKDRASDLKLENVEIYTKIALLDQQAEFTSVEIGRANEIADKIEAIIG